MRFDRAKSQHQLLLLSFVINKMANGEQNLFSLKAIIYVTINWFIGFQDYNATLQNGQQHFRSNLIMNLGISQLNV